LARKRVKAPATEYENPVIPSRHQRGTFALLFALAVVASLAPRAPAQSGAIVPGQSLGPVRLGTPARGVASLGWGQPDRTHASGSISYLTFERQRVTIAAREDQVVMVLTTSERFRTDKGVAVGQGLSAASAAYGASAASGDGRTHWYDGAGLVVVAGGGTILRIGVYDPKTFVRAILTDETPARDVVLQVGLVRASRTVGGTPKADTGATMAAATAAGRPTALTVTLRNASRTSKTLNPNFFTLYDRDGKTYRYDRSTFARKDGCRSAITVKPGESVSCTLIFMLPAGRLARSLVYSDGGSIDEGFI
jgi:uncharacterized protein DUF4352